MKNFKHIVMVILLLTYASIASAESLELQQMKQQIQMLEAQGIAIPQVMRDAVKMFEEDERKKGAVTADNDNPYGKGLKEMSCSDDISGTWLTSSRLTTITLSSNGTGSVLTNDATGQYRTEASISWSSQSSQIIVSYNYVRTINNKTGKIERETRPKTDTTKCQYGGSTLSIGHVAYFRQ